MRKFVVCYLSICDGGDEPSWQYVAMGSYDKTKTVCPDSCGLSIITLSCCIKMFFFSIILKLRVGVNFECRVKHYIHMFVWLGLLGL